MGFYPYGTWCQGSAVMCHLNRKQAYKQVKPPLPLCRNVRTRGYEKSRRWHKRKETNVETHSAKVSQFSSNGALVGGVLSLKLWLWGKAAAATEAKHSWDSLLLNQSLQGGRSVLTLRVWARPTCVLTTVIQDAATDMSRVTLQWVTRSAEETPVSQAASTTCSAPREHFMKLPTWHDSVRPPNL